jgi:hypothetical protein
LHEFGHNVGINHGARLKEGSRGKAIWETGFIETYTGSPTGGMIEYGSDVTPMGRGSTPDGHFVLPSKIILDWVSDADTVQIPLGASCNPCGPYLLQPIDTGERVDGIPLGIRIETPVHSRYFWIEHRTKVSSGSAAVITSAAYKPDHAEGGVVSKSVMVDKLQDSNDANAFFFPAETVELDVGEQSSPTPLYVDVTRLVDGLLEVSLRTAAVASVPSPLPPAPAPLLSPSPPPLSQPSTPPPSPSPSPPSSFPPPPPPPPFAGVRATVALPSCDTMVRRMGPGDPSLLNQNQCSGWGFMHAGTLGSSKQCERSLTSVLLHFKLPAEATADGIEAVKLSMYIAGAYGGGASIRLDGLGTRSDEQLETLLMQDAQHDWFVGFDDPKWTIPGTLEIDRFFYKQGDGAGYTHEYSSPALTAYIRSQVAAGGAGKYIVLRLSPRLWYGCEHSACSPDCLWRRIAITRTTEVLEITGAWASMPPTARTGAPPIDGAALTSLWKDELLAQEVEDDEADYNPANDVADDESPPWMAYSIAVLVGGSVVLCATGALLAVWCMRRIRHQTLRESTGHKSVPRTSFHEYGE